MSRKLALITGGTSGIGLGIAKSLLAECDLALTYANNSEKAFAAKAELEALMPQASVRVYGGAVMDFVGAQNLVVRVQEDFSRGPDILVNSAGRIRDGMFLGSDFSQHQDLVAEHLMVPMALTHLTLKEMYKNKFGRIINMSSISARFAKKGQTNYAAAKAGLEGFTKTLAIEVAHRGVTVNAIAPGLIETPMTKDILEKLAEVGGIRSKVPAGRAGVPEDIGSLVHYLVFQGNYITGQVITVDGGRSLGDPS